MRIAITGGTGFIGGHLCRELRHAGHEVVTISRDRQRSAPHAEDDAGIEHVTSSVTDASALRPAMEGCDAVAHLAGINFERGRQTYDAVHRRGTQTVLRAATAAGADRVVLTSYLRARPVSDSGYLRSKWVAEEAVRAADIPHTVLKPAAVFGPGDQLVTHLARVGKAVPVYAQIGIQGRLLRPVAVEDVVRVLQASLTSDHFEGRTFALMGPEEIGLAELIRRIGRVLGRRVFVVPVPVAPASAAAWFSEHLFDPPIVTRAGVRMLSEGMVTPAPTGSCDPLPVELASRQSPSTDYLESMLSAVTPWGINDLRC